MTPAEESGPSVDRLLDYAVISGLVAFTIFTAIITCLLCIPGTPP